MPQIIEVIVSPTGQTRVQTKGFSGASCREASLLLEKALGQSIHEELAGEFYQQAAVEHHVEQKGGP
jgi:hypothetical protein